MGILNNKTGYKETVETFKEQSYSNDGLSKSQRYLSKLCKNHPIHCIQYKKAFFSVYKDIKPLASITVGEEIIKEEPYPALIKTLSILYRRIGNISKSKELVLNIENKDLFLNKITKSMVLSYIKDAKEENVNKKVNLLISKYPNEVNIIYKMVFSILKDKYPKLAIDYGMKYFESNRLDFKFIAVLETRLVDINLENKSDKIDKIYENRNYFNKIKKLEKTSLFNNNYDKNVFLSQLKVILNNFSEVYVEEYISRVVDNFRELEYIVYKDAYPSIKKIYPEIAFMYGDKYIKNNTSDNKFKKILNTNKTLYNNKKKDDEFIHKFKNNDIFLSEILDISSFKQKFNKVVKYSSEYVIVSILEYTIEIFSSQKEDIISSVINTSGTKLSLNLKNSILAMKED